MGRFRRKILRWVLGVLLLGFASKFALGKLHVWFADYGAGVLYVVFFSLLFFFLFPMRRYAVRIPLLVLLATSVLEVLQLWHPPPLEAFRSTFIGKALIGTTFVWWDFPHYLLGAVLGWGVITWLLAREEASQS